MTSNLTGYDIIGNIHGHATQLKSLLVSLGYREHQHGFRRSDRMALFVGDFVDCGPAIGNVISIAWVMVDALAVMGDHEYNAIAFHTHRPGKPSSGKSNEWFWPHSEKNVKQHRATLDQLSTVEMADAIQWFKTLPVALDLDGIRVAHAAWWDEQIAVINRSLDSLGDSLRNSCLSRSEVGVI
ncbi:metallophosphoesterase family protein [Rhodopirellula baltica]|nr:hypothetical protein [Rhodopirellula baltica]